MAAGGLPEAVLIKPPEDGEEPPGAAKEARQRMIILPEKAWQFEIKLPENVWTKRLTRI